MQAGRNWRCVRLTCSLGNDKSPISPPRPCHSCSLASLRLLIAQLVFNGRLKPQIGNYLGGVTEHEIVSFFRRNSDQSALVKRLRTIKAADAYFRDREAVVLVHVPPGDPKKNAGLFELFEQAALQFRALDHGAVVPFAFTTSTLVSSEYNLKKAPSVVVLRAVSVNAAKAPLIVAHYNAAQLKKLVNAGVSGVPGAPVTTQASPKSIATVTEFVRKHALSQVVEYSSDTHNLVFSQRKPLITRCTQLYLNH